MFSSSQLAGPNGGRRMATAVPTQPSIAQNQTLCLRRLQGQPRPEV
jgi:hypothetical protein